MKNLLKVKTGIIHSGRFHLDDVLSTVLITELNPNINIIRVGQYEADDNNESEIVFDIGLGKFDHYDINREFNAYGHPFSSFGKFGENLEWNI